jgi:hypothetical protein
MAKRWVVAAAIAMLAILSTAGAGQAQGLGQAISNALSNNCSTLGNPFGVFNPRLGLQLNTLCGNPPPGGGGG